MREGSLHPAGLSPRIVNLPEWRSHLMARLRRQIEITADPDLAALMAELQAYPVGSTAFRKPGAATEHPGVIAPLQLVTEAGMLSFLGTTTIFGTPIDITLSELVLEAFFPADAATAEALRRLAAAA